MRALSLTCSTNRGSLAITDGQTILASQSWKVAKSHAELITENLKEALTECQLSVTDLDALVIDRGPGSFTGIRIATNTIRSLSYATQTPIYSLNSLEILAANIQHPTLPIATLLNAYSNSVYFALYSPDGKCLVQPQVVKITELSDILTVPAQIIGDALDIYQDQLIDVFKNTLTQKPLRSTFPCALVMAKLFHQNKEHWTPITWKQLLPFYLRLSSAEEKRLVLSQA